MAENGRQKGDAALVLALASGQTARDAAHLAGVGERTVTRRLADQEFRREVEALRADLIRQAAGRLVEGMTQAADTLRSLLGADSATVRLGAARTILELAPRLHEAAGLEERLRALEERLAQTAEDRQP
jgi:hypothetical protein